TSAAGAGSAWGGAAAPAPSTDGSGSGAVAGASVGAAAPSLGEACPAATLVPTGAGSSQVGSISSCWAPLDSVALKACTMPRQRASMDCRLPGCGARGSEGLDAISLVHLRCRVFPSLMLSDNGQRTEIRGIGFQSCRGRLTGLESYPTADT